jgi:hypothetical protein
MEHSLSLAIKLLLLLHVLYLNRVLLLQTIPQFAVGSNIAFTHQNTQLCLLSVRSKFMSAFRFMTRHNAPSNGSSLHLLHYECNAEYLSNSTEQ